MLNTPDFESLLTVASEQRLRVVLIGDRRQLGPVGRGGMFEHARELLPSVELAQVHRFEHSWEAAASLKLRAGEAAALDPYFEHGRVVGGPAEAVYEAMLADWAHAHDAGRRHAFNVPTNEQARYLNGRAQERLLAVGQILPDRHVETALGERLHVGDLVATRLNARAPHVAEGERVRNRETWTVTDIAPDGSLRLEKRGGQREVTVAAGYALDRVELAYFRTTHGVQGVTAQLGGTLVDERSGFRSLYTGMTRGRLENTAFVVCEEPSQAREVMERALQRDRTDLGVLTHMRTLERSRQREVRSPAHRPPAAERDAPQPEIGMGIGL